MANVIPKRRDFKFGIQSDDGRRSGVLHVWTRRSQVYIAARGHGGIQKISLHTPQYCQEAYDQSVPLPKGVPRRQSVVWQRASTPPAGLLRVSCPVVRNIPTDTLSRIKQKPDEQGVVWLPAAPKGQVTIVEFMFTSEAEQITIEECNKSGRVCHLYWPISDDEAFVVSSRAQPWSEETFAVPASHHEKRNLVISPVDPDNTGRPVRFTVGNRPLDGGMLVTWEYGAYWSDTLPAVCGTFDRQVVVALSSK